MKNIKLDLSQFKHLKTDDKTTTLQHGKHGHQITLVHSALSKDNQAQLKALSGISKDDKTDDQSREQATNYGKVTVKDDPTQPMGKVKMMADGGDVPAYLAPNDTEDAPVPDTDVRNMTTQAQVDSAMAPTPAPQSAREQEYNQRVQDKMSNLYPQGEIGEAALKGDRAYDDAFAPVREKLGISPRGLSVDDRVKQSVLKDMALENDDKSADNDKAKQDFAAQNDLRARAGLPPLANPNASNPVDGSQPTQPQDAGGNQTAPPTGIDPQSMLQAGYNKQIQGINDQAKAIGDQGKQQFAEHEKFINDQQQAVSAYKNNYQNLENERQAHMEDIKNGYIDPNKYWDDHSKLATGIGMILAGFNPTTSPNAAISFVNQQMDRNIQAQTRNLGAKENMLAANLKQFGNLKEATDMTKAMQVDIVSHQLQAAAAKAASPMAKAAALQAAGQLQMQVAPMMQQFAMRRAIMGLASGANASNPDAAGHIIAQMAAIDPEKAKTYQAAFVPGIGISRSLTPVPENIRSQLISHQTVNDLLNQSLEFSKKYGGSNAFEGLATGDRTKVLAQARTIQNQLIGQIKQAQHDGVYKPSEAEFLLDQIGNNPASPWANYSSVPKIQKMQDIKQSEYSHLAAGYDLPNKGLPQASRANQTQPKLDHNTALQWAMQNPNDPRAAKIRATLGK